MLRTMTSVLFQGSRYLTSNARPSSMVAPVLRDSKGGRSAALAGFATVMATATMAVVVRCEQANEPTAATAPYDNLPEEDEETNCDICKINRRGPCRPLWRKFEACMKDNAPSTNNDNGDESNNVCDKYMMDWIPCVQQHRMLYLTFNNQVFQEERLEVIETAYDVANSAVEAERKDMLDLTAFLELATNKNSKEENPESIVEVFIPKIPLHTEDGLPLEMCYAKSSNTGVVYGFEYFSREKEEKEESGDLRLYLTPDTPIGDIVVYKIYKEEVAARNEKDSSKAGNSENGELEKEPEVKVIKSETKAKFPQDWNNPQSS